MRCAASARPLGQGLLRHTKKSHERLARLLRERGVRLRRQSPTEGEVADMQVRYAAGARLSGSGPCSVTPLEPSGAISLRRVSPMRDPHGR